MLYDCFIFADELMMLEIRLNTLADVVDKFILVEATHTHAGQEKPLYYQEHCEDPAVAQFKDKIVPVVYHADPEDTRRGREAGQRNAIMDGLRQVGMKGNDIVFVCDLDEIWRPKLASNLGGLQCPCSLGMDMFYYSFNCRLSKKWRLAAVTKGRDIVLPQAFRNAQPQPVTLRDTGWHFSYLASPEDIRKKLLRFCEIKYGVPPYTGIDYIADRIRRRVDLFSNTQFEVVPLDAPRYVMENQERFAEFIF